VSTDSLVLGTRRESPRRESAARTGARRVVNVQATTTAGASFYQVGPGVRRGGDGTRARHAVGSASVLLSGPTRQIHWASTRNLERGVVGVGSFEPSRNDWLERGQLEANLAAFTWINSVKITKHWPNTVVVSVKESVAVAVAYTTKHVLEFVDESGRALGPAPSAANLPTLDYLEPKKVAWPYQSIGRGAAYVASQLPSDFGAQVSRVTDDASGVVTLKMTTPLTFIIGPPTNLHAKFVAIASVIAHSTLDPGDVVDVTVPDELAVTPPGSS